MGAVGLGHVRYLSHLGLWGSPFRYISISVPEWSRCHFQDHHQINFGTFFDHFGTKNFKHLITLTIHHTHYAAGQSTAGLNAVSVCFDVCLINDRSYKVDQHVA